jgi:hypothetical protein
MQISVKPRLPLILKCSILSECITKFGVEIRNRRHGSATYPFTVFNRIQAIILLMGLAFGVFFYGAISPSKLGLTAPS